MGGGAAKSRLSSIMQKCAILLHEKIAHYQGFEDNIRVKGGWGGGETKSRIIKDFKTILGYRGGGGAVVLKLSREDKICAIFILQGFLTARFSLDLKQLFGLASLRFITR